MASNMARFLLDGFDLAAPSITSEGRGSKQGMLDLK